MHRRNVSMWPSAMLHLSLIIAQIHFYSTFMAFTLDLRDLISTCYQYVPLLIKHLIFHEFRRKHSLLVHGYLSLSHNNTRLLCHLNIHLEYLVLKFLDHREICLFEVSNAQLKHLQLFSQLSQQATLFVPEQRVMMLLAFGLVVWISWENGLEKVQDTYSRVCNWICRLIIDVFYLDC